VNHPSTQYHERWMKRRETQHQDNVNRVNQDHRSNMTPNAYINQYNYLQERNLRYKQQIQQQTKDFEVHSFFQNFNLTSFINPLTKLSFHSLTQILEIYCFSFNVLLEC
jgi:hypothetical protein